jgi:hypothetical protein
MSEWNFVGASYALAWATILGYATYAWRRARRAERALIETRTDGGKP